MHQREEDCVRLNKCEEPLTVRIHPVRVRPVARGGLCRAVCVAHGVTTCAFESLSPRVRERDSAL